MELKEGEKLDDLLIENRKIIQNKNLYMFTSDSILLSRFAECKKTDRVVDLCSGSGIVGIHLYLLKKPKTMVFVEYQKQLANMCTRTIEMNEFENMKVLNCKLQGVYKELGSESCDVVVCNPPYEKLNTNNDIDKPEDIDVTEKAIINLKTKSERLAKFEEEVIFDEIACEVNKLLKFAGKFYTVLPAKRVLEACDALRKYKLEPKIIQFVYEKNEARIVLIKAVKGGKTGVRIIV